MRIAIFGCGNLGRTLGASWAVLGHEILWCSSNPAKAQYLQEHFPEHSRASSYADGARQAEVILYTTLPCPLEDPLLARQVVIDCRNPRMPTHFDFEPPVGRSLAEELAAELPMATVVKALHLHAQETYELTPEELREQEVTSFLCGDKPDAITLVSGLVAELGLLPVPCGPLKRARLLESLSGLWQSLLFEQQRGMTASLVLKLLPDRDTQRFGGRMPAFPQPQPDDPPAEE